MSCTLFNEGTLFQDFFSALPLRARATLHNEGILRDSNTTSEYAPGDRIRLHINPCTPSRLSQDPHSPAALAGHEDPLPQTELNTLEEESSEPPTKPPIILCG